VLLGVFRWILEFVTSVSHGFWNVHCVISSVLRHLCRKASLPVPRAARGVVTWIQLLISPDSFIPEKWGPCSVTCGQGFRKREVQCKIFLEFSRTIARLPDGQCQGPKPSEVERCVLEPCSAHRYRARVAILPNSNKMATVPHGEGLPGSAPCEEQWKGKCLPCRESNPGLSEQVTLLAEPNTSKMNTSKLCDRRSSKKRQEVQGLGEVLRLATWIL
jgi:hypothetical protein